MKLTTLTIIKELMEEAIKSTDKNAKDYTARLTKLKTQLDELSEESPFADLKSPIKSLNPSWKRQNPNIKPCCPCTPN